MSDYERGHVDGYADATTISHPINTNGHTFEVYRTIKAKYAACIFAITPTDYERGYGDGFDKKSVELGYGAPTEEQAEQFYDNL